MPIREIVPLLQKKLGLDINSIGQANLDRALQKRLRALGLSDVEVYLPRLKASSHELSELIDEVVVPETWFFRDTQPFEAITRHVLLKLAGRSGMVRLLSAPCSTGEEAYSMAITLLEAGVASDQFRIVGIDVSKRSIARALKAEYRRNSFREKDIGMLTKYFRQLGENNFSLNRAIHDKVRFQEGNLLDPLFMEALGTFDILFCRNVLIYLDARSRGQALAHLEARLAPDGLLFVGHSESGFLPPERFRPAPYFKAFAFRRVNPATAEQSEAAATPEASASAAPAAGKRLISYAAILSDSYRYSTTTRVDAADAQPQPAEDMAAARRLADEGRHEEAAALCRKYLNCQPPVADAYFLLGLINDEMGNSEEAMRLLRKAVYLEPNHKEALVLLALLAERAGDLNRAAVFRERANRVRNP